MGRFCESTYEETFLRLLEENGWEYTYGEDQTSKLFMRSAEFLSNGEVREIETRADLKRELSQRESGGVFVCTIQKFSEGAGLINERGNIICFSDEAHRTQLGVGSKLEIVAEFKSVLHA